MRKEVRKRVEIEGRKERNEGANKRPHHLSHNERGRELE
jgi:hypothetical protein